MKNKLITVLVVISAAILLAAVLFALELTVGIAGTSGEESALPVIGQGGQSEPPESSKSENLDRFDMAVNKINANIANLDSTLRNSIDYEFLSAMKEKIGISAVEELAYALSEGKVTDENIYSLTGYTRKALISTVKEELDRTSVLGRTDDGITEMGFVGDTMFAEGYSVMNYYTSRNKGVEGIVSTDVLEIMRSVDIMMANNEFTLTARGKPVAGKTYTFRGNPANVSIYHEMGVDIVGLANNHAFDWGEVSLLDTLSTLDSAGIAHVGAGTDLENARAPYYYIVNGRKIAIVAGSAIDPYSTQGATANQSGVFQIFDTQSMCRLIAEAKEQADIVIAYVHWGTESTTVLTDGQKSMGKAFVDAGADAVIGMHSHCMQGVEFYKGKLIAYSLGNFIFSGFSLTNDMIKITIDENGELSQTIYPMMQSNTFTHFTEGSEREQQMALLRKISINAVIADDGTLSEPS